ncbi:MAG: Chromosome partition protein Smc [Candidatus Magasanikbacteria bacterium GW2011_GWC2_37_14]|uniref:Chromosome partition protein Smc n=1 Tax=Candidatus Magasanikbacteria bacterium GW2011_GWC2_37_14 TaxID=1619046 RepID=A0A0G0JHP7_9BACT|nr:MAG: Chromosome partition protein Smc [Candidatus Magasanikbacteria bacterium GW2011_GWC2_37_14]
MYLKSLEIHGFKSFAQKAFLEFLPQAKDGRYTVTSVVGPNGAGKSNISDAIRWVMGEQSMKMLRGKKGEDIIFSGSDSKGQMGMAAVTMILDNADKRVPIDYDELVITRRFYRSGESEYLVNNNNVRLIDLQILLAKAQFGQGAYSVIGQGTIDRLLLQTPQERKDFFDEACGIKEFQIKRHQAALKLYHTKENIDQATALLNEVEPRLRTLSRQVKKLEQRQEVEIQLRECQEKYFYTLYYYNQTQLEVLQQELKVFNKEYTESNAKLLAVQEEMARLAREESRQEVFANLQKEYQEILRQKNLLESEKAVLMGKLQTEYSKAGKQNVGWLQSKINNLEGEVARLEKELTDAENNSQKNAEEILLKKKEVEEKLLEHTEIKGKIGNLEQKMLQVKNEQSYMQYSGLKAVQAVLEERHRLGVVYGTVAQLAEVDEKYRLALDVAAGGNLSSVVVDNDGTAQKSIEYLRAQELGVATFMPLNKIRQRIVSQDINELKNRSGVHGLAVELAKFDSRFNNIFSYVLGNTLIVDNLDVAREIGIGRIRMVTLEGDVVEVSGSLKGGYRKKERARGLSFSYGDSPYLMGTDLVTLEEEILTYQKQEELVDKDYELAKTDLQSLLSGEQIAVGRLTVFGEQKQELARELSALQQELSVHNMTPEEYSENLHQVEKQKSGVEKEIKNKEKELLGVEEKMKLFNEGEEKKKQRIFALQDAMQEEQTALSKIVEKKNDKQVLVAKLETKQEDLSNEVYQELHTQLTALKERGTEVLPVVEMELTLEKIQKLKYQLSLIGGIDEEVMAEYQETKERYGYLDSQLTDLNKALTDLESLIVELDELMKKKRDKAFKQIKKEFSRYFAILFDGGKADLVELYGESKLAEDPNISIEDLNNELENEEEENAKPKNKKEQILLGVDVIACPPGKKIKNIQALSGGERTLASIALVCAILHTNPPPFVVLDEVEAALDEANTLRFTKILQELSNQSQFVVITHNRVTMHASDALYGVTMGADGISHLLSVKLTEAEKIVD